MLKAPLPDSVAQPNFGLIVGPRVKQIIPFTAIPIPGSRGKESQNEGDVDYDCGENLKGNIRPLEG
jgi:hypothetical protein